MSYASLYAPCFVCKRPFFSNPQRVPSYDNQPICRACIERVNEARRARGLPEWPVYPDSYEPIEAEQL